jgi:hypothetical protein
MTNTIHHLEKRVRRADRWNDIVGYLLAVSIVAHILRSF